MLNNDGRGGLTTRLDQVGYYPELVAGVLDVALADEEVVAHLVQADTELDEDAGVFRHLTALVLTPTRLVLAHVDEHSGDHEEQSDSATATTEAVPLRSIRSVAISHVVADPEKYSPSSSASELMVAVSWGSVSRVALEPVTCADPDCTADHGLTGQVVPDDATIRVSATAEGQEAVRAAAAFAQALSRATST